MPSRASYTLRVGGSLKGDLRANAGYLEKLKEFFANKPTEALASFDNKKEPWPNGFVLKGYYVCAWEYREEEEAGNTVAVFRADVHHIQKGTLYANRGNMIPDVQWFYHSPEYLWHTDLKTFLLNWNQGIPQESLICQVWFRDWMWYCGNGGGT